MEIGMQIGNGMKPHKARRSMKWSQLHVIDTMNDTSKKIPVLLIIMFYV
jgi:hypothetical protein